MTERVFNFSAGPATLPLPVLEEAQRDLLSLPGVGMSILEISHRSTWFDDILQEAEANLRRILGVPDDFSVLFLQGGAQLQFSMVPMNFLGEGRGADYILTGSWGSKAIKEAQKEGAIRVAWDGSGANFVRVPEDSELDLDSTAEYVHLTSNETIQGVQFKKPPAAGEVPLVCDASSDFLSRPIDFAHYGLIYACAQKNAGPAGMTAVLVSERMLERCRPNQHSMLDYRKQADAGSRYNTSPVFAIYVFLLITRWIENEMGGLEALVARNAAKAARLYQVLDDDGDDFYHAHAERESRSTMNVTFRTNSPEIDTLFIAEAGEAGLVQLKGHRSLGGMRASIYNAMPVEGVEALRNFMLDFRSRKG